MSLLAVTSGDIASGVVEAEGVDFDGVNDYLSRSTDLVGNVDSKTFTFSCWVYKNTNKSEIFVVTNSGTKYMYVVLDSNEFISFEVKNAVGTVVLRASTPQNSIPIDTWTNIICSCDLSNVTKRAIFINDILVPTTWSIYSDSTIKFTGSMFYIASDETLGSKLKGRLSHVFLSYDYIDLSIEANRRIFINEDGTAVT